MIDNDVYNGVLAVAIGALLAVAFKRSPPVSTTRLLIFTELLFDLLTVLLSIILAVRALAALIQVDVSPVGHTYLSTLLDHLLLTVCLLAASFGLHLGHQLLLPILPDNFFKSSVVTLAIVLIATSLSGIVWFFLNPVLTDAVRKLATP